MPVTISINADITLQDLQRKKRQGYVVEETPHVGNLSTSTLALLALGLQAKLVDLNIGSKDNLFYPHCRIHDGQTELIADPEVMTTHNKTRNGEVSVADYHLRDLRRYRYNLFTHSEWMSERQEVLTKTVEATFKGDTLGPGLWGRYVNTNGLTSERRGGSKILDKIHKITVPSTAEGWVVPNPMNILFDLVCGAMESGMREVYMLSGQSMYKYITQPYTKGLLNFGPMSGLISSLYDAVRRHSFADLPHDLSVTMVPVPVIRHFVAPSKLKSQLDEKLRYFQAFSNANARCGKHCADGQMQMSTFVRLRKKRSSNFKRIEEPLAHVCADSETGMFYTQHDLCATNDTIYVPDCVMDLKLSKMMHLAQRMGRVHE